MTSNQNEQDEQYLHLLNLDGFDKVFQVYQKGEVLFEGHKIHLNHKDGLLLPLHVQFGDVHINYSTAEIVQVSDQALHLRLNHPSDVISIQTTKDIVESNQYEVRIEGETKWVTPVSTARAEDELVIQFK